MKTYFRIKFIFNLIFINIFIFIWQEFSFYKDVKTLYENFIKL